LIIGHVLAFILQKEKLSAFLMKVISGFPSLVQFIIKQTHGKVVTAE
jgi:hypothetical protein